VRFRSAFLLTLCFNALIVVVEKGAGFVILWILKDSPDAKGAYDLITILPILLMTLANQGLATSLVYFTRRGEFDVRTAGETTGTIALISGVVVGFLTLAVLWTWSHSRRTPRSRRCTLVVPILLTVPFLLITSYRNSAQLVLGHIRAYNVLHLLPSLLFLPAFLLSYFVLSDREHIFAGVWARFFPAFVVAGVAIWLMRKHIGFRPRLNGGLLSRALGYGWRANVNSTLTWLNHRIDLFLMLPLLISIGGLSAKEAAAQVAFYSLRCHARRADLVRAGCAERPALQQGRGPTQARSAGLHSGGLPQRAARLRARWWGAVRGARLRVRHLSWRRLGALVRGRDAVFRDPARWHGCLHARQDHPADLAARGRINTCIGLGSIVLVSMTLLDLFLVPQLGAVGAATGSSIAYVLSAIVSVIVYVRGSRVRISQLLIPHSEDREQWRDLIQSLRARFGPKPKAHATKAP
jgi:hypothetical protein